MPIILTPEIISYSKFRSKDVIVLNYRILRNLGRRDLPPLEDYSKALKTLLYQGAKYCHYGGPLETNYGLYTFFLMIEAYDQAEWLSRKMIEKGTYNTKYSLTERTPMEESLLQTIGKGNSEKFLKYSHEAPLGYFESNSSSLLYTFILNLSVERDEELFKRKALLIEETIRLGLKPLPLRRQELRTLEHLFTNPHLPPEGPLRDLLDETYQLSNS